MTLSEVEELLNANGMPTTLSTRQYDAGFTTSFERVEVSAGGVLSVTAGFGPTPESAQHLYAQMLCGATLVHSVAAKRTRLTLPKSITRV